MAKETKQDENSGVIRHREVIPFIKRRKFCLRYGSSRYTTDWLYSSLTTVDRSVFTKSDAEKAALKAIKS